MRTVESLLQFVGVVALTLVAAAVRVRWARRRRRAVRHGEPVVVGARLAMGSGRPRRGSLVVFPWQAGWYARRGGEHHDLAGAQVLSTAVDTGWNARGGDVVVRLTLPAAARARLHLLEEDAATLVEVLQRGVLPAPASGPVPQGRPPRLGVWAVVSLVLGGAWFTLYAGMALTAETATATVTGGGGGTCQVAWTRPDGRPDAGEVDCFDEPAGSTLAIWVFSDDPGDVDTPGWFSAGMVGLALALGSPGALASMVVRRRRRAWRAALQAASPGPSPVALPPSTAPAADDLLQAAGEPPAAVLARLAPHAARRVPEDGWEKPGRPAGARGLVTPRRVVRTLVGPACALLIVLGLTGPAAYDWFLLHAGPTGTATGTSTGDLVADEWGPLPADLSVRYRAADGTTHVAGVPVDRRIPDGEQVTLEYAVDHPGWARFIGPDDALDRAVGLALVGSLLVLFGAAGAVLRLAGQARTIRRAGLEVPRPGLGLLTADEAGAPVVVVCDPLVTPARFTAVPLAEPLPHGTARLFAEGPSSALAVHGRLADGAAVVLEIPGREMILHPRGRAFRLEPADLRALLDPAGILVGSGDR
jgi:hypothetical protein